MGTSNQNLATLQKKSKNGRRSKKYGRIAAYPFTCRNCGFNYIGTICPKCKRKKD